MFSLFFSMVFAVHHPKTEDVPGCRDLVPGVHEDVGGGSGGTGRYAAASADHSTPAPWVNRTAVS